MLCAQSTTEDYIGAKGEEEESIEGRASKNGEEEESIEVRACKKGEDYYRG